MSNDPDSRMLRTAKYLIIKLQDSWFKVLIAPILLKILLFPAITPMELSMNPGNCPVSSIAQSHPTCMEEYIVLPGTSD